MKNHKKITGFTLLEILIALFIFTVVSTLLVAALHNIIGTETRTASHAERMHQLQRAMLLFSRDVEQTVNRPVLNSDGRLTPAFVGNKNGFQFTHSGFANPFGAAQQSNLQRTAYQFQGKDLVRQTWNVLDQAPNTKAHERVILDNVKNAYFEYLDHDLRFHDDWPLPSKKEEVLPRAIRIIFTLPDWGQVSQLYVIAAEA